MDLQFSNLRYNLNLIGYLTLALTFSAVPRQSFANENYSELDRSLLRSVKSENIEKFEELLEQGANPNAIFGGEKWDWVMCLTASMENLDFLKIALKYGGDINLRSDQARQWESSPIHCSITTYNRDINLEFVLNSGGNPNIFNCELCKNNTLSPYFVAAGRNKYSMVYKMLEAQVINEVFVTSLVRRIGKRTIDKNSEEFQWRTKVIAKLRSLGYKVDDPYEE